MDFYVFPPSSSQNKIPNIALKHTPRIKEQHIHSISAKKKKNCAPKQQQQNNHIHTITTTHQSMPLESTMPSPTPPTSYLNGIFDDLDSLGTLSGGGRRTTLSDWPLDLQSKHGSSGTTPQPHPDSEKDSLGAAIDRIGASGDTGGELDDNDFGGAYTPNLIGSSLGSSLGSLGVASLSLGGGTPESQPLGTIPSAKVVQPDEWDSRSSYSKHKSSDNKSEASSHLYREETIMPASPSHITTTHGRGDKPHFHRRTSIDSTVLPPTSSMEIIGNLGGKSSSTDKLPKSRKPPVPTPINASQAPNSIQAVSRTINNPGAASGVNNKNGNPLSPVSALCSKGKTGKGRQVTPLQAKNFSPESDIPQEQPVLCTTPPTGVFPAGSVRSVSRVSGGAQLANEYEEVMPLDLSLLRDSHATVGLGSFNLLSITEGSASPTIRTGGGGGNGAAMGAASFTLGDSSAMSPVFSPSAGVGSVMRDGSFTLDTSSRRQSTGVLSSNASKSGYRRYGGTVASVSALEKHMPIGEASGLDFSLNSGPQRRARSAESSRAGSFTLSETTPVQRRVSPPSTSSEHRALFEELIRLRSEQEGSGSDWAAIQLNVSPEHAHPLGDGGDHIVTSPSPHPPSEHRGSGTVHVVPYPPPPSQPGDIVRTTRRRYKPDVVPVSLESLCKAMETGEVERPERVWYVHPEWSEGVGDGGGAQRVIQYPITTPPLL